jgi:biotin operon repressor
MTELAKQLAVAIKLGGADLSTVELCEELGIAPATLKRYVRELRHMGARIESYGGGRGPWFYRLLNWPAIQARVMLWYRLEEDRRLTGSI